MKFYFFILCSISNVEGGVWFGPKDGLGGDDGEIINFMRPRKVFAAYTNVILFVTFNGPYYRCIWEILSLAKFSIIVTI